MRAQNKQQQTCMRTRERRPRSSGGRAADAPAAAFLHCFVCVCFVVCVGCVNAVRRGWILFPRLTLCDLCHEIFTGTVVGTQRHAGASDAGWRRDAPVSEQADGGTKGGGVLNSLLFLSPSRRGKQSF